MTSELIEKPIEYVTATGDPVKLTMSMVKRYLVSGKANLVTDQELIYFMHVCRARKLNPFIKDCYLIKYDGSPAAIITSVDYFRKNARKAPDCHGWQKGVVVATNDGAVRYSKGIVLDGEKVVGGWFRAQPEGWTEPYELEVNIDGYIKKKDGRPTQFWQPEKQATMIAKVAEAQGLKTLWGEAASGMIIPEEITSDIDMAPDSISPERRFEDVLPENWPSNLHAQKQASAAALDDIDSKFVDSMGANFAYNPHMADFLAASAKHFDLSVDKVKEAACENPAEFIRQFHGWITRQQKKTPDAPAADEKTPDFRSEWIHLRSPGYATFVHKNIARFKSCSPALADEARTKWQNFYDAPWPLDDTQAAKAPTDSKASAQALSDDASPDKAVSEKTPPAAPGIDTKGFDALIQTDEWQEMSVLQQKYPDIYAAVVTNGKMPQTTSEVVAIIDEIEQRAGEAMPGA